MKRQLSIDMHKAFVSESLARDAADASLFLSADTDATLIKKHNNSKNNNREFNSANLIYMSEGGHAFLIFLTAADRALWANLHLSLLPPVIGQERKSFKIVVCFHVFIVGSTLVYPFQNTPTYLIFGSEHNIEKKEKEKKKKKRRKGQREERGKGGKGERGIIAAIHPLTHPHVRAHTHTHIYTQTK